jgi:acylphosphatase
MIRRQFLFTGRVQGVGFRCTARDIAGDLCVAGWVKNSPDGRVQMEAQGAADDIDALLSRLRAQFTIRETAQTELPFQSGLNDFRIEY